MDKRGQVTVFIVVGILILAAVAGVLFLRQETVEEQIKTETERVQDANTLSEPVKSYVRSCLEQVTEDSLIFVSKQGGYYELPEHSNAYFLMPYYFYDGEVTLISKEQLSQELAKYVDDNLFFCLRNFDVFVKQGYEIKQEEIETKATIDSENVLFDVNFPVTIRMGEAVTSIEYFSLSVPTRLGTMHQRVDAFLQQDSEDASTMCISCITNLALMDNFKVEINTLEEKGEEEGLVMFTLVDEQVLVNEKSYRFSFLNKYQFEPLLVSSFLEFEE